MRNNDIQNSRDIGFGLTILGGMLTALAAWSASAVALCMARDAAMCGPVSQHCLLCVAAGASLLASIGVIVSGVLLMKTPASQPTAGTGRPR